MMKRQDPTFRARENEETGQTLISGMGELHLEVIKHRLLRDFNLDVRVHKPRVSYRETIERTVEVTGECHRTSAGNALGQGPHPHGAVRQGHQPVTVTNALDHGCRARCCSLRARSARERRARGAACSASR